MARLPEVGRGAKEAQHRPNRPARPPGTRLGKPRRKGRDRRNRLNDSRKVGKARKQPEDAVKPPGRRVRGRTLNRKGSVRPSSAERKRARGSRM